MMNSLAIIGREKEIELFEKIYNSGRSEFVAVYGRLHIGKTYLVKELFKDEFLFHVTGVFNGNTSTQMIAFNKALKEYGYQGDECHTWIDAFEGLKQILINTKDRKRSVIFIDVLPCLDTLDSEFLPTLDWFWNTFGSSRNDIMLIVCGSSTSWMLKKLLKNKYK